MAELGVHLETCRQRGLRRRDARRLDQLSAARRGDLEVDRRHQRRLRRAVQSGLARRHGRRRDHRRRGLRRRRQRHPGAHPRLRDEILDVAAGPAPRPADASCASVGEGLRAVRGEPRAGDDGVAHPRLPRHGGFAAKDNRKPACLRARQASPARRDFDYGRLCAAAGDLRAGAAQDRGAPAGRAATSSASTSSTRCSPATTRRHRHHRQGGLYNSRAARAGALGLADGFGAARIPILCSTSPIRWCRTRSASSAPASARC